MIIDGITLIENTLPKNVQITPLSESQRLALSSVNSGEMVFQTDQDAGIYVYNGNAWQPLATFDITGKLELSRLPSTLLEGMKFKGSFDASNPANLPTPSNAADATNNVGWFFICTVAGTINSVTYDVRDFIISDGTQWVKISNVDTVRTVNNIQPINGNINVTFGGDVSTSLQDNTITVNKIKNIEISGTPAAGKVLKLSSASTASWDFVDLSNISGDISVSSSNVAKVLKIQNVAVSSTAPVSGQVLQASSGTNAVWKNLYTTVGSEERLQDSQGEIRSLPGRSVGNATIGLQTSDAGKNIVTTYATATTAAAPLVTISKPATPIFQAGQLFSIFNNSALDHIIKIDSSITTCYVSGTDTNKSNTADLKISKRGIVTVHFIDATTVVLSGNIA